MPIIKSSIKDVRRIKSRTARNQAAKSNLRTAIKKVRNAKDAAEGSSALRAAMKTIDKACANGIIKLNTASRHKARLASFIHKKFAK